MTAAAIFAPTSALAADEVAPFDRVDAQFFGDVYLTNLDNEGADNTGPFSALTPLLSSAIHNVVNFEGVATSGFVTSESKNFLLRMPTAVGAVLRSAGIDAVTLANNHAMDFGAAGLHDTLAILEEAGIDHAGAGRNDLEAQRPLLLASPQRTLCIAAFSRTLPSSFWADATHPGTAFADAEVVARVVKDCKQKGFATIVTFHWGKEGLTAPLWYQRDLAHKAIDAGADAVIGHHPHVVQSIERYAGHAIFYSLGNAVFHSRPLGAPPSGMVARLLKGAAGEPLKWEIVPLNVDNRVVDFRPRPAASKALPHPSVAGLISSKICQPNPAGRLKCAFE